MTIELPEYIEAPIRDKLLKVIEIVSENLPEQPDEAYVNTTNEQPQYNALWLFTSNLVSEIRHPLTQDRIQHDIAHFTGTVDWMRLTARKYDFQQGTADSELGLEFTTTVGLSGELSAIGKACPRLMELYRDRFLPNFNGVEPS